MRFSHVVGSNMKGRWRYGRGEIGGKSVCMCAPAAAGSNLVVSVCKYNPLVIILYLSH